MGSQKAINVHTFHRQRCHMTQKLTRVCVSNLFRAHVGHAAPRSRVHGHLVAHLAHVARVGGHGHVEVHAVTIVHVVIGLLAELRWRLLSEHTVEGSR